MTKDKSKENSKKVRVKDDSDEIKTGQEEELKQETKLIEEGPEQKFLEYYSKENLIDKLKELEIIVKSYEEKIKDLHVWKNKYTLLQAEFENAQKRWDKSRQNLRTQQTAYVLKDFLSLYDSFKKAIENTDENDPINQFYNQFLNILKSDGAKLMDVKINDSFDYTVHEALSSIEREDLAENIIVDIVQDGWKLGNDVLRYAKVIISKKPKPLEPEKKEEEVKPEEAQLEDSESTEKKTEK